MTVATALDFNLNVVSLHHYTDLFQQLLSVPQTKITRKLQSSVSDFALARSEIALHHRASLIAAACAMLVHNLNALAHSPDGAQEEHPLIAWYEMIEDVTGIQKS